jgi:hypothetical protein
MQKMDVQTNEGNLPDTPNDDKLKGQENLNQDSQSYCYEDNTIDTPSLFSERCTRRRTQPTKNCPRKKVLNPENSFMKIVVTLLHPYLMQGIHSHL